VECHGDGRRQIHQGASDGSIITTVVLTGEFFRTLGKLKMASESQSDLKRKRLTLYELSITKEASGSRPLQELLMTKEASGIFLCGLSNLFRPKHKLWLSVLVEA